MIVATGIQWSGQSRSRCIDHVVEFVHPLLQAKLVLTFHQSYGPPPGNWLPRQRPVNLCNCSRTNWLYGLSSLSAWITQSRYCHALGRSRFVSKPWVSPNRPGQPVATPAFSILRAGKPDTRSCHAVALVLDGPVT